MSQRSLGTFRRHLVLTAATVVACFALSAASLLFVPLFAHLAAEDAEPEKLAGFVQYVLFLHEAFWPVIAGSMAASIVSGFVLFQRMRSPLVRFVHVFRQLARGQAPEPLVIRRADYLHYETQQLNAMVAALHESHATRLSGLERLEAALEALDACGLEAKGAAALHEAREALPALRGPRGEP